MGRSDPRNEDMRSTLADVRKELLDFGLRNPLLNYRPLKSRGLTIEQVSPAEVFGAVVGDARELPFLPVELSRIPSPAERDRASADPSRTALVSGGLRKSQDKLDGLPTTHSDEELDDRLLATYYSAKSSVDEQGVNTLYIALGFLSWAEPEAPQDFHRAPLILIPIELERKSASEGFTAKYSGDDILPNVCLLEYMKQSHGIEIESYAESEDLDVGDYFRRVGKAVSRQAGWSVDANSIAVAFFSFAKFLMFRDLDPETWENEDALLTHDVLSRLLGHKYFSGDSSPYGESDFVDDHLNKNGIQTVVDADSTQSLALLDVAAGTNMVIQGPPGTGKSQTIVNVIAQALAAGKKVLFVSEKKAALDVVKARLDRVGLGAACLELHSNKVKKKAVIEELKRTSGLRQSAPRNSERQQAVRQESKAQLDTYCNAVNASAGNSQETVRDLYGVLLAVRTALKGVEIPEISLPGCDTWSSAEVDRKRRKTQSLQDSLSDCPVPERHCFWGTQLRVVLPSTTDNIRRALNQAADVSQELLQSMRGLAQLFGQESPRKNADLTLFIATTKQILDAPDLTGIDVGRDTWTKQRDAIKRALSAGENLSAIRSRWNGTIRSSAWSCDVKPIESALAELEHKWWRFLSPRWKNAKAQVADLIHTPLPTTSEEILAIPAAIRVASGFSAVLAQHAPMLTDLFGQYWKDGAPEWTQLNRQCEWITATQDGIASGRIDRWCLSHVRGDIDRAMVQASLSECERLLSKRKQAYDQIITLLKMDPSKGSPITNATSDYQFSDAKKFWSDLAARTPELDHLVRYLQARDECVAENLGGLAEFSGGWISAAQHLVELFEHARVSQLLSLAFNANPVLSQFDGAGQTGWVETFKSSDTEELQRNRASIGERHTASIPRSASANGQLGVLLREFEKKARHLAVRQLINKAGNAIQAMKPVFMMSPLSVANFLPPGAVEFDLVVFDEASQVKPSDALGAIVRGRQSVVVGDSKQLPPTSFFDTMVAGDDLAEEDDGTATSDVESVLGLFCSRGAHQRMLRWHYRSRHESLIAGSNHLFYDDRLVVFPSPDSHKQNVGLIYRRVDGAYDRSRTRTNRLEAKAIATAVMQHATEQMQVPREQRQTLGVAALSKAQMDAIQSEIELLRRKTPSCEEFFSDPDEQFFVKNLETLQGDERDVIFISIGYARTAEGYLSMGFGPVNRAGGERRLNVLFSRARKRCEVFTSLSSADIDADRNNSQGLFALKSFLHFAEHGQLDLPVFTGGMPQSPFEEQVLSALQMAGYTVHSQVGSAGFYLDLAIVDPARPGHYVLGVECDGAAYHSARSTRDRDRLRQAVLEAMGWKIHRIWSTSWFRNPESELQVLQRAIQAALAGADVPVPPKAEPKITEPEFEIEAEVLPTQVDVEEPSATRKQAAKYQMAQIKVCIGTGELHSVDPARLSAWLAEVVEIEGPIHWIEAARRVASAAGVQKVGSRIQQAFKQACRSGSRNKLFIQKSEFLFKADSATMPVRDRSDLVPQSRKLEYVAPEEIATAIELVVDESFGLNADDVATATCRLLGFVRVSEEMRSYMEKQRDLLIIAGRLIKRGEVLVRP